MIFRPLWLLMISWMEPGGTQVRSRPISEIEEKPERTEVT